MTLKRASGVLLHPTSLPSLHGIGDLGKSAYEFVDFLQQSGQTWWQILPLAPTGYEHSPYTMNFSTFAGNPLLISLEQLSEEGLLKNDEVDTIASQSPNINFNEVISHKMHLLRLASDRFWQSQPRAGDFDQFCEEQSAWLDDFVLFMALLADYEGKPWSRWDRTIAQREPTALKAASQKLHEHIQFHEFLQFKFFEQWSKLRQYANQRNIKIIGDISIYVCHNSADVWANPTLFKLDAQTFEPAYIAGVPPDYFSATGQLWGNPVYDWDQLQQTNFAWWIQRFQTTLQSVDWVRIDHFRGFEAYWQVPAGEQTAIAGKWIKAPGDAFFETLLSELGSLPILAEDLGIITPEVEALRDRFNFPGMRILMFAFDGDPTNIHLPQHYVSNSIVYTGTHDNDTVIGWWNQASSEEKQRVAEYLGFADASEIKEINWALIRMAFTSVSELAIVPLQDLLGLDNQARMNDPSQNAGNWRWRYSSSELLTPALSNRLLQLTERCDRSGRLN
jgi:4-alpha-glucanotransferase